MNMVRLLKQLLCSSLVITSLALPVSTTKAEAVPVLYQAQTDTPFNIRHENEDKSAENKDPSANVDSEAGTYSERKERLIYRPAPEGCEITIVANDIQVAAGTIDFSILEGVVGMLDTGEEAFVWVVNDGGFSIDIPGRYYVTYAAMKTNGLEYKKRKIFVSGERIRTTLSNANDENYIARYERFIKFIGEKGTDLLQIMRTLDAKYKSSVAEVISREKIFESPEVEQDMDTSTGMEDNSAIQVTNWPDIIATFIAINSVDVSNPYNTNFLCSLPYEDLASVFWDMNTVSVLQDEDGDHIVLSRKTYSDVARKYGFNSRQTKIQQELMRPEYLRSYATLTGLTNRTSYTAQNSELLSLQANTVLSEERTKAIRNACSLVGKVDYLWGGKYNELGEHPDWKAKEEVDPTITGTESGTGIESEKETIGLDCSGFISWVLINTCGYEDMLSVIGNGSSNQWWHSSPVAWEDGQPGDLAFFAAPGETDSNHVGIIVAKDVDGSYLIAHCSSKDGGVVITDAWSRGFRYIRSPILYEILEASSG